MVIIFPPQVGTGWIDGGQLGLKTCKDGLFLESNALNISQWPSLLQLVCCVWLLYVCDVLISTVGAAKVSAWDIVSDRNRSQRWVVFSQLMTGVVVARTCRRWLVICHQNVKQRSQPCTSMYLLYLHSVPQRLSNKHEPHTGLRSGFWGFWRKGWK